MPRPKRYRPRLEFLHLELQLIPYFEVKVWQRFLDELSTGEYSDDHTDYRFQFRLLERILTLHGRRNRWNGKRQLERRKALEKQMRPEFLGYAIAGLLRMGELGGNDFREDLVGGALCVDLRLTRKFLRELETIHEQVNPSIPPWVIGRQFDPEAENRLPTYREFADFEASLRPVPVPAPNPPGVVIAPEAFSTRSRHAEAPETSCPARAAS